MDGSLHPIPPVHDHYNMFFDELYGHDQSLLFHAMEYHHHHQFINTDLPYMELSMFNQPYIDDPPRHVNEEMAKEINNKYLAPFSDSDCQNWPSSSSLSLSSMDFPECNHSIPVSDQVPAALGPIPLSTLNSTSYNNDINVLHDQAIEVLRQTRNPRFPNPEEEHEVMTRAILAVLSNPNSSSYPILVVSQSVSSPSSSTAFRPPDFSRQRVDDEMSGGQLHHSMCERRRREKLNENFQTLRSLLPPGTKKDKVSVLSSSVDHLASLRSQISELTTTNHKLETELLLRSSPNLPQQRLDKKHIISNGAINVLVSDVAESSSSRSGSRMIDLQVTTGRDYSILDLSIRLLELLEETRTLRLMSFDTKTLTIGLNPMNTMILRLNIIDKDKKWDQDSFQEAVRRAVAELAVISP